jgi:hypothetical protein
LTCDGGGVHSHLQDMQSLHREAIASAMFVTKRQLDAYFIFANRQLLVKQNTSKTNSNLFVKLVFETVCNFVAVRCNSRIVCECQMPD